MGDEFNTRFIAVDQITRKENEDFQFNWIKIDNHNWIIFGLKTGSKLIGLIALVKRRNFITIKDVEVAKKQRHHHYGSIMIAFALWYSFRCNDDGYVNLTTKTNGTEKFYQKLGAIFISDQRCYFNTLTAINLINKYEPKEGFRIVR